MLLIHWCDWMCIQYVWVIRSGVALQHNVGEMDKHHEEEEMQPSAIAMQSNYLCTAYQFLSW